MRRAIKTMPNAVIIGVLVFGPAGIPASAAQLADRSIVAPAANEPAHYAPAEDKIDRFVDATQQIGALRHAYAPRFRSAGKLERRLLRAQARNQIAQVLRDNGLSHAEYRAIGAMMETEPRVQERLIRASG